MVIIIIIVVIIIIIMTTTSGGGGTRYLSWSIGGKQHYLCSLQVLRSKMKH